MSKRAVQMVATIRHTAATCLALAVVLLAGPAARSGGGPVDAPVSFEPRVPVAKCLSFPGLWASPGQFEPFAKVQKGEPLHSRDILVALPGFTVDVEPNSGAVQLSLRGNLPGLSDSPVRESAIILHDTRAYDLDFTLLRGRVVLTSKKDKGAARIWLRTEAAGVEFDLPEKGDSVALEIYGRWPAGVPFSLKESPDNRPVQLWEVHCLKGNVQIKAGRTTWGMAAPPGPAYFHGDSIHGPAESGPERRKSLPTWADPKAAQAPLAKEIREVVNTYSGKLKSKDAQEATRELIDVADKDPKRGPLIRDLLVHALVALDDVEEIAKLLGTSRYPRVRDSAVLALRHWIGARPGRDEKLYHILQDEMDYTRAEAETILQMLHSPFNPRQAETFETLIAYLRHRKQAIRQLAHWHLDRLTAVGRDIPFDAADSAACTKAVAEWRKRIPAGELPKEKEDDSKGEKPGAPKKKKEPAGVSKREVRPVSSPVAERTLIIVRLPASARLWFDGDLTTQTGAERTFVTPELPPGKRYRYTVVAAWDTDGMEKKVERVIRFGPGARVVVDLTRDEPSSAVSGSPAARG